MVNLPRPSRTCLAALLLFGVALPAVNVQAQPERSATLRGEVRTSTGAPVTDALVQLEQNGADPARVRTLDNGNFTVPRLTPGDYMLTVRRLGYSTDRREVSLPAGVTRVSIALTATPVRADLAAVTELTTGLTGTVGDFALMEPLKGVSITRMGGGEAVTTDEDGRFVLPVEKAGVGAIRVERAGFAPRLISYDVNEGARVELSVLLDSGSVSPKDQWVWRDLDLRSKWNTPRTVRVPRAELAAAESRNLLVALEQTPSLQESGVIITRAACVFVNGQPRPGYPVDAIRADQVEYVEAFPVRTELSRTLPMRWPPNGTCGAPGGDLAVQRAIESGQGAQFVSVWLR